MNEAQNISKDLMAEDVEDEVGDVVCLIRSPLKGKVYNLEDVPDPAFSKKIIGDGVAILPEDVNVFSPTDNKVVSVFGAQHAVIFEKDEHIRILLHVGIGSMRLQGEGFRSYVDNGQDVSEGDKILSFDLNLIKKKADSLLSPIVFVAPRKQYAVRIVANEFVDVGDPLFELVASK